MAQKMTAYQAGGGDARFRELKKRYPYRSEAGLRSMIETAGRRALAGRGKKTASQLTKDQAFSYGGGNAALRILKNKSGNSYSDSYLRGQIEQRGRRAIAGRGDGSTPTPTPTKEKPAGVERNWTKGYGAESDKPSSGEPSSWPKGRKPEESGGNNSAGDKDTNATPARPKHGINTARINELMTKWKAAKGAEKDRLGRQIHNLKYEKTKKGLKIRRSNTKEKMSGTTGGYARNTA